MVYIYATNLLFTIYDMQQFAYRSNRSTDDAIAFTLHPALSHLENKTRQDTCGAGKQL